MAILIFFPYFCTHKHHDMEHLKIFTQLIANELHLSDHAVENTLKLLDEGCTIPFISRYRKERTGGLDEVQITSISNRLAVLQEIAKRKDTVVKTITELGKMTADLEKRINDCWESTVLEDIYLPYKPKRRTRAQIAREQGLEPLAQLLLLQREPRPEIAAKRFVCGDIIDAKQRPPRRPGYHSRTGERG